MRSFAMLAMIMMLASALFCMFHEVEPFAGSDIADCRNEDESFNQASANTEHARPSSTGGLYYLDFPEFVNMRGVQPPTVMNGTGEVLLDVMADRGPESSSSYVQEPVKINPYVYGQNYVIRVIDWIYPTANRTLVEYAKQIKVGILRFPGGNPSDECYWDRQNTPGYDFDTGPSPYSRTLRADYVDAYMRFCREIGAEPFMQVCLKYYNPGLAADLVKYCNKDKGYNIRYWEIGNEPDRYIYQNQPNYTVHDYEREYMDYYRAMKAVDPTIKIMGSNPCVTRLIYDWLEPFLQTVGTNCSVGTSHYYPLWAAAPDPSQPNYPTIYNLLRYDTNDWTNSGMLFVEKFTKEMRRMMDKYAPGGEIGITEFSSASGGRDDVTELGGGTPGLSDAQAVAVWAADVLGRFGRNRVDIANYWIMASTHDQCFAMITDEWDVRPVYYTYLLYALHFGPLSVWTKSSKDDKLSMHASTSNDGSKLYLMVANKDTSSAKTATINISGFEPSYQGASYLISAPSPSSDKANVNGWTVDKTDIAGSISRMPAEIIQTGRTFNIMVPACSVAFIEIPRIGSESPGINLTIPKEGEIVGGAMQLRANAVPPLGASITKVDFRIDDNEPINDTSFPFGALWNTSEIDEGTHLVYATMHCNDGTNFTTVANVTVRRNLVLYEMSKFMSDGVTNGERLVDDIDASNNFATFDTRRAESKFTIEFSKPIEVDAIKAHFWDGTTTKYRYRLEHSVDGMTWLGDDRTDKAYDAGWQTSVFTGEKARFVRIVSRNSTTDKFQVIELQVFGKVLERPNATIAGCSPEHPLESDAITFFGKMYGPFAMSNASWSSSINGELHDVSGGNGTIEAGTPSNASITVRLSAGMHNISFKAIDVSGLEAIANATFVVLGNDSVPVAYVENISSFKPQKGEMLIAEGRVEDADNDVVEYIWISNVKGLISTGKKLEVSNLTTGIHEITFLVRDSLGFSSNVSKFTIEVLGPPNKPPVAQVIHKSSRGIVGNEIRFEGKGIDEDGTIVGYGWYSDKDGLLSTDAEFTTKNLTKGKHNISFRVCDNEGAWSENVTFALKIEEEQPSSLCGTNIGLGAVVISAICIAYGYIGKGRWKRIMLRG